MSDYTDVPKDHLTYVAHCGHTRPECPPNCTYGHLKECLEERDAALKLLQAAGDAMRKASGEIVALEASFTKVLVSDEDGPAEGVSIKVSACACGALVVGEASNRITDLQKANEAHRRCVADLEAEVERREERLRVATDITKEAKRKTLLEAARQIEGAERGQREPYALGTFPKFLRKAAEKL